ncbi:MAG: hypothetical protein QOE80_1189 [Actinomycetota bacterium]|nr:hypothetical protein [Actinomycetota bacterium]
MDAHATGTEAHPRRRTKGSTAPSAGCRFVEGPGLWILSDDADPEEPDLLVISDDGEPDLWVLSGEEVPLHRLIDRAKPSLAEATALAALVLEAVADLHDAGEVHGALDTTAARIDAEGNVRLDPGRPPVPHSGSGRAGQTRGSAGRDGERRRADVRAAAGVVAEIAMSAGRPARPLTGAEERMAARLASASDPRSLVRRGPRKAAHGLDQAVGSAERRQAARRGLVALTEAVVSADTAVAPGANRAIGVDSAIGTIEVIGDNGVSGARGPIGAYGASGSNRLSAGPVGPYGSAPPAAAAPPARRLPPPARRPPIWPRVWKGVAAAVVVALVLGVELRFFGASVQRNVHVLMSGNVRAAAAGPRRPAPLPVLGPAVAPPVTHLEVRPLDGCRPESVCNAVVQVTVTPQDQPLDIAWAFELVDRCRSGREPRPGGVLQVPPGRDRAVQTVTLPLPAGRSLVLIPVTSSPVLVAGTPMRLSPDNGPC